MKPEQSKRARIAGGVPAGYGLGAGLWSLTPLATSEGAPPAYLAGLILMMPTLFVAMFVYVIAGMVGSWILGRNVDWPGFRP